MHRTFIVDFWPLWSFCLPFLYLAFPVPALRKRSPYYLYTIHLDPTGRNSTIFSTSTTFIGKRRGDLDDPGQDTSIERFLCQDVLSTDLIPDIPHALYRLRRSLRSAEDLLFLEAVTISSARLGSTEALIYHSRTPCLGKPTNKIGFPGPNWFSVFSPCCHLLHLLLRVQFSIGQFWCVLDVSTYRASLWQRPFGDDEFLQRLDHRIGCHGVGS